MTATRMSATVYRSQPRLKRPQILQQEPLQPLRRSPFTFRVERSASVNRGVSRCRWPTCPARRSKPWRSSMASRRTLRRLKSSPSSRNLPKGKQLTRTRIRQPRRKFWTRRSKRLLTKPRVLRPLRLELNRTPTTRDPQKQHGAKSESGVPQRLNAHA